MIMKKTKYVVIVFMLLLFIILPACSLPFDFSGCNGGKKPGGGGVVEVPGTSDIKLNFEIKKKDTFYYPTLTGKVRFDFYPEKLTVYCADEEKEIKPTGVLYAPSYITGKEEYSYIFTFDSVVFFSKLDKGDYDVVIYGYKDGEKTPNATVTTLKVEKDLFFMSAYDFATGEQFEAMDAEDNWTKPY